jgi:hypothetical protein
MNEFFANFFDKSSLVGRFRLSEMEKKLRGIKKYLGFYS